MQSVTDKLLVKKILAGDETSFRRFFNEYVHRIYRFALTRVGHDQEAAKDIAQQTMTKALKNMSRYRGEAQLFTWLCAICRNESIDWLRRNQKHAEHIVMVEDNPGVRAFVESLQTEDKDNPDNQHLREQGYRLIQVALDQLPARYGDALEWKYIEGYSVLEIAQKLKISKEATHSLLARAKRAFADLYNGLHDGSFPTHKAGPNYDF